MNHMARVVAPPTEGRARFTTAEFLRMSEAGAFDGMKIELIEGDLERMPPPGNAHGLRQISLLARLIALFGVERVRAEQGIDLGDDTVVGCDGAVLRAPITADGLLEGPDVLVVIEVAETTLSRDLEMKRAKYANAGIPYYWVVDGRSSVIHVFDRPVDGDYARVATVKFGEPLAVPETDATITLS